MRNLYKSCTKVEYVMSPRGCHFEWFSIENCIEKWFEVSFLIEFSIQISLFSKAKFTRTDINRKKFELSIFKYSSLRGCHFEWFSIENCIEKCNKTNEDAEINSAWQSLPLITHHSRLISPLGLIEFSIQISLFSKAKFTCLPRNAGRLELTKSKYLSPWTCFRV